MLTLAKRVQRSLQPCLLSVQQLHYARSDTATHRRRPKSSRAVAMRKSDEKSEWWIVDGEMHEIGDNVPPRERFVIPRDNIPNKRRKQLREQFMRRTRLVIKEAEHEPWCKRYMELYQELRENWERLYWDEGYSKKLGQDHTNYESAEEDDEDFSPYRSRLPRPEQTKEHGFGRNRQGPWEKDQGLGQNRQGDNWEKVRQVRDKFEYDRERRMREKAFAPMNGGPVSELQGSISNSWNQPFDAERYFSPAESD